MNWLRTIAVMVAVLALTATGAFAHAVLTSSVPQDGSRLEGPPEEIVLQFSEPVRPVRMKLAGSGDVPIPELAEGDTENNVVRVPVPAGLEPGSYILSYSVTSVDGHPVAGSIAFGIGQASAAAPSSSGTGKFGVSAGGTLLIKRIQPFSRIRRAFWRFQSRLAAS